jgi:hypothetical protein
VIINKRYRRISETVQAIQVTEENMAGLAKWCYGRVMVHFPGAGESTTGYRVGQNCVEVVTGRYNGRENKTRAYVGDWIANIEGTTKFRVYRETTFLETFEEIRTELEKREAIQELMEKALTVSGPDLDHMIKHFTDKVMNVFE